MFSEFTPKTLVVLRNGYSKKHLGRDLLAGLTVAIIALPLAMAFAISSGVTPERGLYTAIVAGFLISALGGSTVQIGGPTGAFIAIVYGIVMAHGYAGLAIATLMAGVILILLGLARFGNVIKFIPYPVTTGFTSGIAVIIFSSQIRDFFGLKLDSVPAPFLEKCQALLGAAHTWNPSALGIGVLSLTILIFLRIYFPRVPNYIFAVLVASGLVHLLELPVETIGSRFGDIPRSLPFPTLPEFSWQKATHLIPEATTIAILAGIESLLSCVIADGMTGTKHNSNGELVGQGIANIGSIIFGGIPATGAIARTAANIKSGAVSPFAGMFHAIFLLLFILFLAPLAKLIPLPSLAAILFIIAWNMSERDHFRYILRSPRSDVIVLLTSFLLTVLVDLTVAVQVGVVMAALLFMKRMSEVSDAVASTAVFQDEHSDQSLAPRVLLRHEVPPGIEVFQMSGPFFFGVADRVKDILKAVERPPKVFILRMRKVPVIDATGLHALQELFLKCKRDGITFILSGVRPEVDKALQRVGLSEEIGRENMCENIDRSLERAKNILGLSIS